MFNIKLFLILILSCFFTKSVLGSNQDNSLDIIKVETLQNQNKPACSRNLTLNSKKYYTFSSSELFIPSLFGINIDLQSPPLRRWMKRVVDILKRDTGITPENAKQTDRFFTDETHKLFFDALLERVIPILIFNQGKLYPKFATLDLGVVLSQQRLGCLELSLFFSVVFAEYGIPNILIFSGYHYPEQADIPYFPPCLSIKYSWGRSQSADIGFLSFDQDQANSLMPLHKVIRLSHPLSRIQFIVVQPKDL